MYEYEFVRINLNSKILNELEPEKDYQEIVKKYSKEGWRLVQIFAPPINAGYEGCAKFFELIFERQS